MRKFERIIALVMVLILVIFTNVVDKTSFTVVKNSVTTIFEDRLIAYDLTYKMQSEITKRRVALLKNDVLAFKSSTNQFDGSIDELVTKYAATELTRNETENFELLQKQFNELKGIEKQYVSSQNLTDEKQLYAKIETQIAKITESLNSLASIQITEGRRQLNNSNKAINSSDTISKIEIISMLIIAAIIIFLIIRDTRS